MEWKYINLYVKMLYENILIILDININSAVNINISVNVYLWFRNKKYF